MTKLLNRKKSTRERVDDDLDQVPPEFVEVGKLNEDVVTDV